MSGFGRIAAALWVAAWVTALFGSIAWAALSWGRDDGDGGGAGDGHEEGDGEAR